MSFVLPVALSLLALAMACGSRESSSSREVDNPRLRTDATTTRCIETKAPSGPQIIYLAFDGATLEPAPPHPGAEPGAPGKDDATKGLSSLVQTARTFRPFRATDPDRDAAIHEIVRDVEQALAPFAAKVSTKKPDADHLMVVFAGESGNGLLGFAHQDCGNQIRNNVSIIFEQSPGSRRGRFSLANETMFQITQALGLGKSDGPGHPCSCDERCYAGALCRVASAATVMGDCQRGLLQGSDRPVQDEVAVFASAFGCREPSR